MSIAISGWAWRTPLGGTIDAAVARLLAGERAAIANPRGEGFACTVAAAIAAPPAAPRQARFLRRLGLHGLEVAREALAMARARGVAGEVRGVAGEAPGERVGLFSAVGGLRAHWDDMMAGLAQQRDDGTDAWARGLQDVHPYWMLRHLSNNVHALASAELALRGEGATFGGGNASAQAIAAASRALRAGAIDAALVVAYDSLLEPETLVELGSRRAATHVGAGEVAAPYDRRAAGFVPGEAAAALVLVRDEGADTDPPLAWIEAIDGADGAPGEPDGATMGRVLGALVEPRATDGAQERATTARALGAIRSRVHDTSTREATTARTIAVVDGAARAWPDHDAAERALLGELVGAAAPLTAITAAMGQLGAATSAVQAIALAECLRRGMLPPIAGLAEPVVGPLVPLGRATATDGRIALALATAAPGLVGAIRVEVPR